MLRCIKLWLNFYISPWLRIDRTSCSGPLPGTNDKRRFIRFSQENITWLLGNFQEYCNYERCGWKKCNDDELNGTAQKCLLQSVIFWDFIPVIPGIVTTGFDSPFSPNLKRQKRLTIPLCMKLQTKAIRIWNSRSLCVAYPTQISAIVNH